MKTLLLILAIGFAATSVEAQKNSCSMKKKVVHRACTVPVKMKKEASLTVTKTEASCPATVTYVNPGPVVKACPKGYDDAEGCVFDANGNVQYVMENAWGGYYPAESEMLTPRFSDLNVTSTAFDDYGVIPAKYTCEGETISPPLNITNIPSGTQSLAVIVTDPKATERGPETYWMAWDIDTTGTIPEAFTSDHMSMNIADEYGYHAVCPKSGTHYYHFTVYALDTKLTANRNVNRIALERAMRGHVLAKGDLVGMYNKHLD